MAPDSSGGAAGVAASMFLSGLLLWIFGEETHPKLNPEKLEAVDFLTNKIAK